MPRVPAYNEIHECIGGVYVALPACNDIHGTIALYGASKFRAFEFHPTRYEYACFHALSSRVYKPLGYGVSPSPLRKLTKMHAHP